MTARVLNVCSHRFADSCETDLKGLGLSSTTVGELLDEAALQIQMGECNQAKDCVVVVNEGHALVAKNERRVSLIKGVVWNLYHLSFDEGIEYSRAFSLALSTDLRVNAVEV